MTLMLEPELHPAPQDQLADGALGWAAPSAPNVLIVEDDHDLQEGWSVFLRHRGYGVQTALDGCTGLKAIEQDEPDIVLLDLGLPGMHGFKVLHEVRMRRQDARILVVTAESSPEADARARRLGAAAVLCKPVDPRALCATIQDLLDE
jgi:DNA-binding response OmpR family regulator